MQNEAELAQLWKVENKIQTWTQISDFENSGFLELDKIYKLLCNENVFKKFFAVCEYFGGFEQVVYKPATPWGPNFLFRGFRDLTFILYNLNKLSPLIECHTLEKMSERLFFIFKCYSIFNLLRTKIFICSKCTAVGSSYVLKKRFTQFWGSHNWVRTVFQIGC